MKRTLVHFFVFLLLVLPTVSFAQDEGLVPCGGEGDPECQACHVVQLAQNILTWVINIMASIIALIFVIGGIKMVMSAGDTGAVKQARKMITNSVIGFIILLTAWLIMDTVLKTFVNEDALKEGGMGPWHQVQCVEQPKYTTWAEGTSRPVVGGGTATTLSGGAIDQRLASVEQYREQLCAGVSAAQCNNLLAIMAIESGGKAGAISPVGAAGLMQVMPGTARDIASSLNPPLNPPLTGLNDDQIRQRLLDPATAMRIGTAYYNQLSARSDVNGDPTKIFAAYNGGPGAIQPSANCAGMMRYQCEWDDDAHTIPNTGYIETRRYVANVTAVSNAAGG